MGTYTRFLYEFLAQFFAGLITIVSGIGKGIGQLFNIPGYAKIIEHYKNDFSIAEWLLVVLAVLAVILVVGMGFALIFLLIKKYIKFRAKVVKQEELLDEVTNLNKKVVNLMKEKDEILAMKVSQLGLKPTESNVQELPESGGEPTEEDLVNDGIRFAKLNEIDEQFANYKIKDYGNSFTLPEFCEAFRNFAASRLRLYYTSHMMRLFISSLASTKLVILQGISGTGKTSLAYAWGKFLKHDSCVASVQPSWRDRTELFGYFNEFTKKFNETEVLKEMYMAGYTNDIYTIILDEMNISRVEYYFAEMLSVLELPSTDEWIISLVPNAWPNDPKLLEEGRFRIPNNMWYCGTINNDDSTFMVTDKVYDRALPINIDNKSVAFEAPDTEPLDITAEYFESLFKKAWVDYPLSDEVLEKINKMDEYVINHFRMAFGNRILKQIKDYVPVFVACGGDEMVAVDYLIANKILRKFNQLNLAYIRGEIDGFKAFLDETFGQDVMKECKNFLDRLKKQM